jgi:hypothetical protein
MDAPITYDYMNMYVSAYQPGVVHCKDTRIAQFFFRYLIEKIYSVFEFEIPEEWDRTYFLWSLFCTGRLAVFDTPEYGVIFQHCTLNGRGIYYQPTRAMVANPVLRDARYNKGLEIGTDCALVKMQPDYRGACDIVSYYADMLALCGEAAGMNILNSKLAYVFAAKNKAAAETFKKLYDAIASGNPAVVADKSLLNEDGEIDVQMFNQDLSRNYIAGQILEDMAKWDARFNTEIGIPNVNIAKQSGVTVDEVHANDIDSKTKASLWLDTIRKGFEEANKMFGLNLSVKFRFEAENEPVGERNEVDMYES